MNKYFNFSIVYSVFLLSLAQADENQKLDFSNDVMTGFEQNIGFKKNPAIQLSEQALLLFFRKESQLYFIILVKNDSSISINKHLYQYKNNEYFQIDLTDSVHQRLASFVTNNIKVGSLEQGQALSSQFSGLLDNSDLSNSKKISKLMYHYKGEDKLIYEDNIYIDGSQFERFVFLNNQKRLVEKMVYIVNEDTITVEKEKYKITPSELSLPVGSQLRAGESWQTDRLKLVMQHDGNLVLYDLLQNPLWSSHTNGSKAVKAIVQNNGLVLYDASQKVIWSSGTKHKSDKANELRLQKDRNLVLYSDDSKPVWSTHTHTKYDDKITNAIKKVDLDGTKKTYVYDKEFRILVDDKNNKYSWENNKVVKVEDKRGYTKEYRYYEKDGLLKSIFYKDNLQKSRLEESFYYRNIAGKPDLYMKKIHYIDDGSTYIVENTGNTINNPIYQIKELEPLNKTIAYLNYELNKIGLVTRLSLTDRVNNKVYNTNHHYDEQNRLHNISTPNEVDYGLIYENDKVATVIFDDGSDKEIYKINYIDDKIDFVEKQDSYHTKLHYFYDLSNSIVGYKCHSNDSSVCPSIGEDGFLKEEFILKNNSSKVLIDIKKSFDNYYQFTKFNYDPHNNHLVSEKNIRLLGRWGKDKIKERSYSEETKFYDEEGRLIYDGKTKVIYDPMGASLQISANNEQSIHTKYYVLDVNKNKLSNHLLDSLISFGASFENGRFVQSYMLDLAGSVTPVLEVKTFKDGVKDFFGGLWNFARDVNPYAFYLNLAGYDSPLPAYGNESYWQRMKGYGYGVYSSSPVAVFTGDFHFFSIKYGLLHSLQVAPVVGSLAQAAYYRYYNAPSMAYYYLGTASADLSVFLLTAVVGYMYEEFVAGYEFKTLTIEEGDVVHAANGSYIKGEVGFDANGKIEGHG
ncbi:hypothetical protein, partial [Facilibium subflavum]